MSLILVPLPMPCYLYTFFKNQDGSELSKSLAFIINYFNIFSIVIPIAKNTPTHAVSKIYISPDFLDYLAL